jgi:hypothetical protein
MQFQAGKTYQTTSICDAECIIRLTVISRTAKTIKAETDRGVKTLRVFDFMGVERVRPWGSYSMAPTISADRYAA